MTDTLPPLPEPDIPAVYATAQNTASVRSGHEMGGYVKREVGYTEGKVRAMIAAAVAEERERWTSWCAAAITKHRRDLDATGHQRDRGAADALERAVRELGAP